MTQLQLRIIPPNCNRKQRNGHMGYELRNGRSTEMPQLILCYYGNRLIWFCGLCDKIRKWIKDRRCNIIWRCAGQHQLPSIYERRSRWLASSCNNRYPTWLNKQYFSKQVYWCSQFEILARVLGVGRACFRASPKNKIKKWVMIKLGANKHLTLVQSDIIYLVVQLEKVPSVK